MNLSPNAYQVSFDIQTQKKVKLMNYLNVFVVDGQFGDYGDWSKCSQSCTQFRERSCDNPEPAFGGKDCTGETISSRFCVEDDCQSGKKYLIENCDKNVHSFFNQKSF